MYLGLQFSKCVLPPLGEIFNCVARLRTGKGVLIEYWAVGKVLMHSCIEKQRKICLTAQYKVKFL